MAKTQATDNPTRGQAVASLTDTQRRQIIAVVIDELQSRGLLPDRSDPWREDETPTELSTAPDTSPAARHGSLRSDRQTARELVKRLRRKQGPSE